MNLRDDLGPACDGAETRERRTDPRGAASTAPGTRSIGVGEEAPTRRAAGLFEWQRAVRDAPVGLLPRKVKATLLILSTYADVDGRDAFPSMETLGERVGKAADNVARDLKLAEERGYVFRRRRNRQKSYRYRLTLPLPDPTETSGLNSSDPTETSGRDPTETSGYLLSYQPRDERGYASLVEDADGDF
jgi:hypothetical protein